MRRAKGEGRRTPTEDIDENASYRISYQSFYFMDPQPFGSDSGQMKRIPVLTIHSTTERLSPCRYTIYNIDRMMSSAIGFVLLRRQSASIFDIPSVS